MTAKSRRAVAERVYEALTLLEPTTNFRVWQFLPNRERPAILAAIERALGEEDRKPPGTGDGCIFHGYVEPKKRPTKRVGKR